MLTIQILSHKASPSCKSTTFHVLCQRLDETYYKVLVRLAWPPSVPVPGLGHAGRLDGLPGSRRQKVFSDYLVPDLLGVAFER